MIAERKLLANHGRSLPTLLKVILAERISERAGKVTVERASRKGAG